MTQPEFMAHLLMRSYEQRVDRIRTMAAISGAHGYIGTETYCGADLISPEVYRRVILPAQQVLNQGIRDLGLFSITYFCGDINPLIDDINTLGAHGLMIEESKKTFLLDVVDIRRRLDPSIALFGNLDSVSVLMEATPAEVAAETRRQMEAMKLGPFIMANGSPIALKTPAANLHAMIRAAQGSPG
jgi:uroporphyrinogen-III decarboxylase